MATLISPFQYFADPTRARPIFNGFIFIGRPDGDPTNPADQVQVSLICDCGGGNPINVSQPIRTGPGGLPIYQGRPAQINVPASEFSIILQDSNQTQVYYSPRVTGFSEFSAENSITHTTRAAAVADFNENRFFIKVGDYGGAEYRRANDQTEYDTFPDSARFTDAGSNLWILNLLFSSIIDVRKFGVTPSDDDASATINEALTLCRNHQIRLDFTEIYQIRNTVTVPTSASLYFYGGIRNGINTTTVPATNFSASSGFRLAGTFPNTENLNKVSDERSFTDSAGRTHTLTKFDEDFSVGLRLTGDSIFIGGSMLVYAKNGNDAENYNNTTSRVLSDDIDVGVFIDAVSRSTIEKMVVLGHFRKAGTFQNASSNTDTVRTSERNSFHQITTSGQCGLCIRNQDSTFDLPNFGTSGTTYYDLEATDLDHPTGLRARDLGFSEASRCLEISGNRLRAVKFINATIQGSDDCVAFFGDCLDIQFVVSYFESKAAKTAVGGSNDVEPGGLVIAAPFDSNSTFETNNLQFIGRRQSSNVNFQPFFNDSVGSPTRFTSGLFNPRAVDDDLHYRFFGGTGSDLYFRAYDVDGSVRIRNTADTADNLRIFNSGNVETDGQRFTKSGGTGSYRISNEIGSLALAAGGSASSDVALTVSSAGDVVIDKGVLRPDSGVSANTQTLGTATQLWNEVFSRNGTINTSDEREKNIDTIPESWFSLALSLSQIRFKWKSGDNRWRVGYGAQSVYKACIDAGIADPFELSFIRCDLITDQTEDGNTVPIIDEETGKPLDRWGVCVEQINTLCIAALMKYRSL